MIEFIEMMAYSALHCADVNSWRCMLCDNLGKFTEENIFEHLEKEHSLDKNLLKKEKGEIYLYQSAISNIKKGAGDGKSACTDQKF